MRKLLVVRFFWRVQKICLSHGELYLRLNCIRMVVRQEKPSAARSSTRCAGGTLHRPDSLGGEVYIYFLLSSWGIQEIRRWTHFQTSQEANPDKLVGIGSG